MNKIPTAVQVWAGLCLLSWAVYVSDRSPITAVMAAGLSVWLMLHGVAALYTGRTERNPSEVWPDRAARCLMAGRTALYLSGLAGLWMAVRAVT